ncbi:hypothetical protein [Pollutimonas bauzanensis]|uniref:Uncharacterized protein n=1 Tax=Pollutimonas bauzanensis TaxID=658167 RepID=A0A1M5MMB7_9BURK|nr:hypothetical protein [Pollutimonas bauzanensis]SHG77923.1 hypothetical protein SAMN04488135_101251 [Pollutimonas bauzanensis]
MTQDQKRANPSQQDRKQAKDSAEKSEAAGRKATQFDGNPNPQGASSPPLNGEDDTPMAFGKSKESRNDQ